jgi:hypothetical protein
MALNLTSIENVEFYSGHYLDSVLEGDLKGTFAKWKQTADDSGTKQPHERLRALGGSFMKARNIASSEGRDKSSPTERWDCARGFHAELLEALGYERHPSTESLGQDNLCPVLATYGSKAGTDLWIVEAPFSQGDQTSSLDEMLLAAQYPSDLEGPALKHQPESNDPARKGLIATWRELLDKTIFQVEDAPRWVLFLAGDEVYLAERNKWIAGRYLRFDLADLFTRLDQSALKAVCGLLHRDVLVPQDGACLHDTLEEKSHKHAFAVTGDLKHGVRRSVELLANEAIWYWRNVRAREGGVFKDKDLAPKLQADCVTWLYRLLFLFYVEARGAELEVVPMNSDSYRKGYSLESLRDLELIPLTTEKARNGLYLDASIKRLFSILNQGYGAQTQEAQSTAFGYEATMEVPALLSPLFDDERLAVLKGVKFRNSVLQEILQRLSLSAEKRGKKRGRISYAQLGISQLGSVYESLLSYTGFFAEEADGLYEVAAKADVEKIKKAHEGKGGSREDVAIYFVPASQIDQYKEDEFVRDEHDRKVIHPKGSYIYTLAGRSRQKSASFYTPEVLTECVVKYSLKELLWQQPDKAAEKQGSKPKLKLSAAEILDLTICEPAMGSGAFLIEAIDQMADAYLTAAQTESGQQIPSENYQREKRRVKARLATNNCYGVDLNTMAVRLAQVSLWLGSMHEGGKCPWFGLRLANGNSLVGARREVFRTAQVTRKGTKKDPNWLGLVPDAISLHHAPKEPAEGDSIGGQGSASIDADWKAPKRPKGTIYHFLLPAEGMAAFDKDKVVKEIAPDDAIRIKAWRKEFTVPFKVDDATRLERLSDAVDRLWTEVVRERHLAASETTDRIPVWGEPAPASESNSASSLEDILIQDQEAVAQALEDSSSAYRRLKLVMDAWCSMWFWPIDKSAFLPTRQEWIASLELVLLGQAHVPEIQSQGSLFGNLEAQGELALTGSVTGPEITTPDFEPSGSATAVLEQPTTRTRVQRLRALSEEFATRRRQYSESCGLADTDTIVEQTPWLQTVEQVQDRLHFHHWELRFAEVFGSRGGFDLLLGNPPWIKLFWQEGGVLSEFEPLLAMRKISAPDIAKRRHRLMGESKICSAYLDELEEMEGIQSFLGAPQNYPLLKGLQTNLYKCFLTRAWDSSSSKGVAGFLHQEGPFDDPKAGVLRCALYTRLRQRYRFTNDLKLFAEVGGLRPYSVNIYGPISDPVLFTQCSNLFHPLTIDRCWAHDGLGVVPGIRGDSGDRILTGHSSRLVQIDVPRLALFASLYDEAGTSAQEARLPVIHSEEIVKVLRRFAGQPRKVGDMRGEYMSTMMWDETNQQKDGTIRRDTRYPNGASEWVLSGPHFYVATPFNKTPNEGCKSKGDYTSIDLNSIPDDYLPRTNYVPACDPVEYITRTPKWNSCPVTDFYRIITRKMISPTGERTLIASLAPPAVGHINGCFSLAMKPRPVVEQSALFQSLPADFWVKTTGKSNFLQDLADLLPWLEESSQLGEAAARVLLLNCMSRAHANLWNSTHSFFVPEVKLVHGSLVMPRVFCMDQNWSGGVFARTDLVRRQLLVELDVLVSQALGLTLDELITIYRVQFPILQQYERDNLYGQKGRVVPTSQTAAGNPAVSLVRLAELLKDQADFDITRSYAPETSEMNRLSSKPIKLGKREAEVLGVPDRCKMSDLLATTKVTHYSDEHPDGYQVEQVGLRYTDPGLEPRMERVYPTPWTRCDREEDYRAAWAEFERRLATGSVSGKG